MKGLFVLSVSVLLLVCFQSQARSNWKSSSENADYIHRSIKEVTDVIVHDIFSPPVASRIYAYITVAGYEAARLGDPKYISLASQLHGLMPLTRPASGKEYSYALAAAHAILTVGKTLVISEEKVEEYHKNILQEFKETGMPDDVFNNSVLLGKQVADHILEWASKDNYKQVKSLPRYSVSSDISAWKPTPPAYMKAIEPNWNRLRPFLIQSAQQFKPLPPTAFSTNKNSRFFKEASEVRDAGLHLTPEQIEVSNFWDCNPFKMNINGHVMYATKKISPGGHWINITRLACKKANADLVRSAEAYACVSVTLADCFISCWDEKYRSNVIRPETFINQYIDPQWVPLLQTPPFPEYTSGHSVVSMASAIMLTKLFGDNFSFADSTEVEFDIPVRHFKSFKLAAEEAAISRFYGGIHYMPSIRNGMKEGISIGNFIAMKLRTRKEDFARMK
ncbi:vanadium-dependent haloperoxidase [Segetibacter koreensis]|uniref:vanadium-dependent haloperoxidase n=1 Tax=Segetibacter koreensis TaxID=398037 RepID=UPI000366E91B|nr:vanadium-dependent haloperoxidase [Segetibacter koreensis]